MPYKIGGGKKPQEYDSSTGKYGPSFYKENKFVNSSLKFEVIAQKKSSDMPNFKNAITPDEKFIGYSLNSKHIRGRNKAVVYEKALGYNIRNYQSLKHQIHCAITSGNAKMTKMENTSYGIKYTFEIMIKGPNGQTAPVIAGYQIDVGTYVPRMVTNFVKGKNEKN